MMQAGGVTAGMVAAVVSVAATAAGQPAVDIDEIMDRLTLEQKLGQLTLVPIGEPLHLPEDERSEMVEGWRDEARSGAVGAMYGPNTAAYTNSIQRAAFEESEHGIPLIIGNDIIHGYRTIFPIPLASSGTWDLDLLESLTRAAAVEARAAGTHWTFSPMVDISRDPRWGRVAEGAGEDPFLASKIAAARVRGFQGRGIDRPDAVVATAKHFAAYGAAVGGRDYDTTEMSEQTLRTIHLPPFQAAVEAGVGSLMTSFNDVLGVPATASELLLEEILREEWGFDGFVTSDYTSINEMVPHGYARDLQHAAVLALRAGTNMDLTGRVYQSELEDALERGMISMSTVDRSVRRVLEMKKRLGLFEDPYGDESRESRVTLSDEHRALARLAAARSVVLLKNEGDLLPLDPTDGTIGLIGPMADRPRDMLGTWAGMGRAEDAVTLLDGFRRALDGAELLYAPGCEPVGGDRSGFEEAVRVAEQADVVIMAVGEPEIITGEANSRAFLDLPGLQPELLRAVHETGTPMVVLVASGRPLVIPWVAEHADAVAATWHLGVEHGPGVADVVFGTVNPSAKLTMSWPRAEGQIPVYYARKNTGRPFVPDQRFVNRYRDLPLSPLYAFGYGLSYTSFEIRDLEIEQDVIGPAGTVRVSVQVENTGNRAGAEVVQCYIHDRVASLVQPIRQLRGFERVELAPGESTGVTFELGPDELGLWNRHMEFVVEPGEFGVYVGNSSDAELEGPFRVEERE